MSSDFKIAQRIEWCTDLPLSDRPRESPVFRMKDKEWLFRFILQFENDLSHEEETEMVLTSWDAREVYWSYELFLEQRDKCTDFESCRVYYKVGYTDEDTFNLGNGVFNLTDHHVWSHYWFFGSRKIKFRFYFDNGLLSKNINETETNTASHASSKIQNSSDSRTIIHLSALSRDFSKLLDESSNYDVEVRCEDETFRVHSNVLEVRSPVLSSVLNSNEMQGEAGLIKVEDIKAPIFRSFLGYMYSGILPELNIDTAKQLYKVGYKYRMEELKKACSEFLIQNLSAANVFEILVLADQHSDGDFRKSVISYIIDMKIPKSDEFSSDFCKNHPSLANEIMILYIQRHCS